MILKVDRIRPVKSASIMSERSYPQAKENHRTNIHNINRLSTVIHKGDF